MTGSGPRAHRSVAQSSSPTARIALDASRSAAAGSFAGSPIGYGAQARNWCAWIVMLLLIANTTLALYDLWLLISVLAGEGGG